MKIWKFSASGLLRGASAAALAGAVVLGLGSGPASATPFLVDFDPDVTSGGFPNNMFTSDGFTFTFEADGDGGFFAGIQNNLGDGGTDGMDATSNFPDVLGVETVTIVRTDAGDFSFGSIYIQNDSEALTVEGFLGGGTTVPAMIVDTGVTTTVFGGLAMVDTVELRSMDIFIIFDTFTGELTSTPPPIPEPTTLTLFGLGLLGLGVAGRRKKRAA